MMDKFLVGDVVKWHDPDNNLCSGQYTVTAINGEVVTLSRKGSLAEAFANECSLVRPKDKGAGQWVVRFKGRVDGKKSYLKYDGSTVWAKEYAARLDEDTAKQYAEAIAKGHKSLTAWAVPYNSSSSKRKLEARNAAKLAETMHITDDMVAFCVTKKDTKDDKGTDTDAPPAVV